MTSSHLPAAQLGSPRAAALDIVLVTCRTWPEVSTSDQLLADELTTLGHRVRGRAWNDADLAEFTEADTVVLRSNWDYHHDLDGFGRWLDAIEASPARVLNPVPLVRAHLDKSYLERIADAGFRTPLTLAVAEFDHAAVSDWADDHGLDTLVVKPAWGASGHDVDLVPLTELEAASQRWRDDPDRRPMIVQEFVPDVAAGEYALVYFSGEYSHALLRSPSPSDFRVNGQYGGTMSLADDVDDVLVGVGAEIVEAFAADAVSVRVDVVCTQDGPLLMELEVNEPALGLHLAPGSAARFAQAILGS